MPLLRLQIRQSNQTLNHNSARIPLSLRQTLRPKNKSAAFTVAFSTEPKSRRSCHAETFCRPEQLWQALRVISPDHSQQNSRDKVGRGLSAFVTGPSPNPNKGAQTKRLCEIFGGSSDSIRKSPKNARLAFPIRRAADRCLARR